MRERFVSELVCMSQRSNGLERQYVTAPVVQWLSYSPLDPMSAGSNSAVVDGFFSGRKNPEYTSFGREVKPWVPCRRFTTSKRT